MTGHDGADFVPEQDGMDQTLGPTADRVRRVLGSGQMRPAFRDRLRREVVAARQAQIAAGTGPVGGAPGSARRPGRAVPGARQSAPAGRPTAPAGRPTAPAGRPTAPARPAGARRWRPVLRMAVADTGDERGAFLVQPKPGRKARGDHHAGDVDQPRAGGTGGR